MIVHFDDGQKEDQQMATELKKKKEEGYVMNIKDLFQSPTDEQKIDFQVKKNYFFDIPEMKELSKKKQRKLILENL